MQSQVFQGVGLYMEPSGPCHGAVRGYGVIYAGWFSGAEKKPGNGRRMAFMKNRKHLPMMGVGPIYGAVVIAVTVVAVMAGKSAVFEKGRITFLKIQLSVIGILLLVLGVYLWVRAMFQSKIDSHIAENRLATTGVYALVKNPIYSAFMFFCMGLLMIAGNIFFLPLFFFYWIFMTVLMKCTEEWWLNSLYGREYEEYCSRVNRCIPLPKKKRKNR